MSASVFISYARSTHRAEAEALHAALTGDGVACFLDRAGIEVGQAAALNPSKRWRAEALAILLPGWFVFRA